jgi:hypothetical protein
MSEVPAPSAETSRRLRDLARMHLMFGGDLVRGPAPEEAEPYLRAALAIDPQQHHALGLLGKVMFAAGRVTEGLAFLAEHARRRPDDVLARGAYGSALLLAGDYERGWPEWLHSRKDRPPMGPAGREWDGRADLRGRTLLVICCDGFGDAFQFVRYAPTLAARGAKVVFACHPETVSLLRSMPGVAQAVDRTGRMPPFDLWTEDKVVPYRLGARLDNIPLSAGYLKADPARVAGLRARLPATGGRRIGIVWGGDPNNMQDEARSLPPDQAAALLDPILAAAEAQWCSFQLGPRQAELRAMPGVLDLAPGLRDFSDTAAAIACMDLVIGVETAVTHLAGAMGTPAWLMLAHRPDWRWGMTGETTPWYASARLFRQRRTDDWASVTQAIAAALAAR